MTRWEVVTNIGYGWEKVQWASTFDTEEEAWDFVYGDDPTDTGRWDGQVDVRAVEEND